MPALKILLVDDEKEFASTLGERLELRGFQVQVANNGDQALLAMSENLPQVVVLDVKMPGLGGMEVLKRMRANYSEVPVILLTGIGSSEEGDRGMELGAFDCLIKPIQIETLIGKLYEATGIDQ